MMDCDDYPQNGKENLYATHTLIYRKMRIGAIYLLYLKIPIYDYISFIYRYVSINHNLFYDAHHHEINE